MVHVRLSPVGRLVVAGAGLSVLALLLTASRLVPDPRGFGTHEQLGLTPCSFCRWTGRECPTCGATTAWASVLRGEWSAALRANVAGTMLCLVAIVSVPWLLLSASMGRWLIARPTMRVLLVAGSGLVAIAVLDWARRVGF
ncbi:MAG: DUF2752 domain-containing protein [Bythopirellula sp.]|nr:DUF2752 domain-containing protein [Bythopirellula sp.]